MAAVCLAIVSAMTCAGVTAALLTLAPSPRSPALLAGGGIALLATLALLERPLFAACCAIVVIYFPTGILPPLGYSLLIDVAIVLSFLGLLLESAFRGRRIAWTATTALISLFLLWCVVSVMWTPSLGEARQQIVAYGLGALLLFLLHNLIDSRERIDTFMRAFAVGGWTLVVAGLITIAVNGYTTGTRLKIGDVNENLVPTLLVASFAGVLWGALHPRWINRQVAVLLSFLYLAGTALLVLLSGSRGGILSLTLILGLMIFAPSTRRWSLVAVSMAVAAAVVAPFLFSTALERFAGNEGGEFGGRAALWESGVLLLKDYPLGAGLGNGKPNIPHYLYELTSSEEVGLYAYRSTHNPFLDVGIDTGIPGMLLYGGALVAAIISFAGSYLRTLRGELLVPRDYYVVVLCTSVGYFTSWIRDGGMNNHLSLFIVLAMFIAPSRLHPPPSMTVADASRAS